MTTYKKAIRECAGRFGLELIYAFGSRSREIFSLIEGRRKAPRRSSSDIDIGLKPAKRLSIEEKADLAAFFEDLFGVHRADIIVIPEAPPSLACEVVQGELLYAKDPKDEAEYQLYIMRRTADLAPYEHAKRELVFGKRA